MTPPDTMGVMPDKLLYTVIQVTPGLLEEMQIIAVPFHKGCYEE